MGWEQHSEQAREPHRDFFWSRQQADGGFCGRTSSSDLYYTAFALRGLVVLGSESRERAERLRVYLRSQSQGRASVIDLISLVFSARLLESWMGKTVFENSPDWPRSVAAQLEVLRRPDGGYAKTIEGHASSTYQTFLVALTYELLEIQQPSPGQAVEFILSQQRLDGGFVEIGPMRRSGTNPTAAAIGVLRILDPQRITPIQSSVTEFLLGNLTGEGGLRANTQIPFADLLSTYTGLQTIQDVGSWDQIDHAAVLSFVQAQQQPTGGFLAADWDDAVDVEYSFYGIGALGLLSQKNYV